MPKCIIKDCDREAKSRGLCKTCYTSAANAVKRGNAPSWEFLEEHGLALPAAGQPKSPFSNALHEELARLGHQKAADITQDEPKPHSN